RYTPSTNTNGARVDVPIVAIPRTKSAALSYPGSPEAWREIMPGKVPPNELDNIGVAIRCSSDGLTEEMAPVTDIFFCVPNPTTTTSSIWESETRSVASTTAFPSIGATTVAYPTMLNSIDVIPFGM